MTSIRPADRSLHHHDGSHRWTGGDGTPVGDKAWRARMEAHMEEHKAGMDRPKARNAGCQIPAQRPGTVEAAATAA